MADAVKLFIKEELPPYASNKLIFYCAPIGRLFLIRLLWFSVPLYSPEYDYSLIFLLFVLRLGLYPLLLAGWASNRTYALVGALRGVAQTISYEVRLALLLMVFCCRQGGLGLHLLGASGYIFGLFYLLILIPLWAFIGLAETNRTPFDFAEGESELVSGFNIEYGGGAFAFIFIAEYGIIIFLRRLTALMVGVCSQRLEIFIVLNLIVIFF